MSPLFVVFIILGYFSMLITISLFTGRKADNDSFFLGNKQSPWYVVAFGMIGASLSGVTFISVPGWVGSSQFSYMQTVLGYLIGYIVIANILMPMYYRLNLISIYGYLEKRYGKWSYKTGATFFLISRIVGSSLRLFLVANVLQIALFDAWNIPFFVTVIITILLIWLYTFKGGIKTIVFTDSLQTFFMLLAVGISVYIIGKELNLTFSGIYDTIHSSSYSKLFFFEDSNSPKYFWKQFIGGAFIAICMTGLDQDMMQKNLSCKNIKDAQKNMYWFSSILIVVNLLFLALGALLYIYTDTKAITLPIKSDDLYPMLAMGGYFGSMVAVLFILGLIAAAYSSADSALTALTTSFCIDILDIKKKDINKQTGIRMKVHVLMSVVTFLAILIFKTINSDSVIKELFTAAGYTYGPLLGLYSFGLFTKKVVKDKWVPLVCILSPLVCFLFDKNSVEWLGGYKFGFELLLINGILTFVGLWLIRTQHAQTAI